ncbi:hypothetical protein ACFFWC_16250 [Plantactinospora siamensis]|uniref:Secreted protein n=1 Tax=Plantactinospora siamensis TaxID=555372 RepID=A0ABV6NWH9_9ACTN
MRRTTRAVTAGATGVIAAALALGGAALADGNAPTESNGGSIVEDFSYPGAAGILASQGVELIGGDGHIILSDCGAPPAGDIGLIKVYTTNVIGQGGTVCFKVLGSTGRLDLKVPAVYEIRGDGRTQGAGHEGTATVTTDSGVETTKDLDPDGSTQFGVGDGGTEPTTLLQLTVHP